MSEEQVSSSFLGPMNRRSALLGGVGAAAVLGLTACNQEKESKTSTQAKDSYDFHGAHQSGIVTPVQDRLFFVALNIKTDSLQEIKQLFKDWTVASRQLMAGQQVGEEKSIDSPPDDTGEAQELSASKLTLTFGIGRSFFLTSEGKDRFGLKDKLPAALVDIPKMTGDKLDPTRVGGDLCIQACADDPQVAVHAIRNLVRIGAGRVAVAWSQLGFGRTSSTTTTQSTARNLFGFKDGTANIKTEDDDTVNKHVWVSNNNSEKNPDWMTGGSYCATRRIRMLIEQWDRTRLKEQEDIIGRTKKEGAPLSGGGEFDKPDFSMKGKDGPIIPVDAHVRLVHPDQNKGVQILRRGYNYTDGTDGLGHLDAGLFFIAYICDPRTHFFPLLDTMTKSDAMSEYLEHTGSAVFAIPPGIKDENDYIASGLFA